MTESTTDTTALEQHASTPPVAVPGAAALRYRAVRAWIRGDDIRRRAEQRLSEKGVPDPELAWHALGLSAAACAFVDGEYSVAEGRGDLIAVELSGQALLAALRATGHEGRGLPELLGACAQSAWFTTAHGKAVAQHWKEPASVVSLSVRDARKLVRQTLRVVQEGLRAAGKPLRAYGAARPRGSIRAIGVVFTAVLLLTGIGFGSRALVTRTDLAKGRPRVTSSRSTEPATATNRALLFWTGEEQNPWVEVDLGKPTAVAAVYVRNRGDCCLDRAIPLIVELSDDHNAWREVVRREREFSEWEGRFSKQTARYVRLRIPRRSVLHLEDFSVYQR
jgi:hypothetical protein